jgi:integrase
MFNELRRLDEWAAPNPLENIREFKISESEMSYLTLDEIRTLLAECEKSRSQDLITIVKICLATGARWSEAEGLKGNQIRAGKIIYVKTKGKKNRVVPIADRLHTELTLTKKAQPLFKPCYSAFRKAIQRAGIETPAGQLTHVLRHTFASHFMMNGGNILVLQRIPGHTDIKVTMRYAHFAPEHLSQAIDHNPLRHIDI